MSPKNNSKPNNSPASQSSMKRFMKSANADLPAEIYQAFAKTVHQTTVEVEVHIAFTYVQELFTGDNAKPLGIKNALRTSDDIKKGADLAMNKSSVIFGGSFGMLQLDKPALSTLDVGRIGKTLQESETISDLVGTLGTAIINSDAMLI